MYENFKSRCNIIQYLNMKMTLFSISDDCRIKFKHWQEKEPKMNSNFKNSARCEFLKKTFFATALTHGDVRHGGDVLLIRLSAVKS